MSSLLDRWNEIKGTPTAGVNAISLPKDYAPAYYEAMGKNVAIPEPAGVQDIPGAVRKAYKAAGGGLKGIGAGAFAGLGKAGEFLATKTGNQIMAGLSSNPYLAEGYLNNAGEARNLEASQRQMAQQMNIEREKQRGEDVRAAGKTAADERISENNLVLQNMLQEPELALRKREIAIMEGKAGRESKRQDYEEAIKPLMEAAKDAYGKNNLSEGDYGKIISNPYKFKLSGSSHKVAGMGFKAGLMEGQYGEDKNGRKWYKFPDGTFQEVPPEEPK